MEHLFKRFLSLVMLSGITTIIIAADTTKHGVVNQYNIRPQSLNNARKVSGEVPGSALVHLWDKEGYYGYFGAAFEYDQTFRSGSIARSLFGDYLITGTSGNSCDTDCGTSSLLVQGTAVPSRNPKALRAEDFYLGQEFNGTLTFKPRISNFIIDFQFYVGFDECWEGGYFRLYAPFVHTNWKLNMCENITTQGTTVVEGSFAAGPINTANPNSSNALLGSASAYFSGQQPTSPFIPLVGFPITRSPLCASRLVSSECSTDTTCGKTPHTSRTKNGFGDIRAELGWNFWQNEDYHLGVNLQGAAPTGNTPDNTYLFSPIVGNGKHWELGGGVTGHYIWCRSADEERHFGIYLDATITHLFNATQERTFDLKNKELSRYMIAARFKTANTTAPFALQSSTAAGTDATTAPAGPLQTANYIFAGAFTPVANLTKQKVRVNVGAQGDVALWFNYSGCGFSWDLGYNFYGRSNEKIHCSSSCPSLLATEPNTWGLKGDAHMYGFFALDGAYGSASSAPVALSATEYTATISCPAQNNNFNASVDNPGFAAANPTSIPDGTTNLAVTLLANSSTPYDGNLAIRTSVQPAFLSEADIDYNQTSRIITNKIFTHVSYKWDRECWAPFFGIGGEVEVGNSSNNKHCDTTCPTTVNSTSCDTTTTCQPCDNGGLRIGASKWGVWLKTGLAFN